MTFKVCNYGSKYPYLLHKLGFVDSQTQATVPYSYDRSLHQIEKCKRHLGKGSNTCQCSHHIGTHHIWYGNNCLGIKKKYLHKQHVIVNYSICKINHYEADIRNVLIITLTLVKDVEYATNVKSQCFLLFSQQVQAHHFSRLQFFKAVVVKTACA